MNNVIKENMFNQHKTYVYFIVTTSYQLHSCILYILLWNLKPKRLVVVVSHNICQNNHIYLDTQTIQRAPM